MVVFDWLLCVTITCSDETLKIFPQLTPDESAQQLEAAAHNISNNLVSHLQCLAI